MVHQSGVLVGIRTGKWSRLSRLGGLAVGIAGEAAGMASEAVRSGRSAAVDRFHRDTAERLTATLGQMKGLPQKAGQVLSMLDAVLPEDQRATYRAVLGRLQADSEPLDWGELEDGVAADLGAPISDCFARFDTAAVAAASIGQVHRARLADGREVAVKIQYPGVSDALHADLEQVDLLVKSLGALVPKTDVRPLVNDVVETFLEELDYALEARVQAECHARWAQDAWVVVPEVVGSHSGPRVLTTTWLEGVDIVRAEAAEPSLRDRWGATLWRFTWTSITDHSWVHGDPHPGNLRFLPDGRLGILDFGASANLPPELSGGLARASEVARSPDGNDAELLGHVLAAVGLPRDLSPEVATHWAGFSRLLFEPMRRPGFRFSEDYVRALMTEIQQAKTAAAKTALWKGIPTPTTRGTVVLMRTAIGQAAVLARLGAAVDL